MDKEIEKNRRGHWKGKFAERGDCEREKSAREIERKERRESK
jgi:hypothetical protein